MNRMDNSISRQAAIEIVDRYNKSHMILKGKPMLCAASIVIELEALPSAQPEIIHCKDCKYAHITYSGEVKYCDIWFPDESHYMDTDNFCSFAERREDEQ